MPGVQVRDHETFEEAYRKFKKQTDRNIVVTESKARRFFEPKTEIRKKQKIAARKKLLRKMYMTRKFESRL
jgi:small subunit ribosomal protein S21